MGAWPWPHCPSQAPVPAAGGGCSGWPSWWRRWRWWLDGGLPETARFTAEGPRPGPGERRRQPARRFSARHRRTLLLLGAGAFLLALFADPGGSLQNQYLRHQRHLSPTSISILLQVTGTVGGLGTLLGGRLADTHGRRPVAAAGVVALAASTVAVYLSGGVALWWWEALSSVVGYGLAPALGVFGAELFPTGLRGRAGGALTVIAAAGSLVGLSAAGALTTAIGTIAPALAILAVGPLALAVLILVAYPETAARPLEELNPPDLPHRPGLAGRAPATAPPATP